jgi:hypothetical protein
MTSQTKRFIEFPDIVGIQLECKKCGISLLVAGDALVTVIDPHNETLGQCPTCKHRWTALDLYPERGYDTEVKDFIRKLGRMRELEEKLGCKLRFEIKDDGVSSSASAS